MSVKPNAPVGRDVQDEDVPEITLPDDHYLAYHLPREAWHDSILRKHRTAADFDGPELWVSAASRGGGVAWEFSFLQYDFGLKLAIFDDAFPAFEALAPLFVFLRESGACRIDDVREFLDALGAIDKTERKLPAEHALCTELTLGLPGISQDDARLDQIKSYAAALVDGEIVSTSRTTGVER